MRHRVLGLGVVAALVAACGSTPAPPVSPAQVLRDAKASIDNAPSVHFTLSSANVSGTGPLLTGGSGDARRPDGFTGTLQVTAAGFPLSVDVVSVGGTFYASTPLSGGRYLVTNPSAYGFGDPGKLLDPANGLSSLLTVCSGAAAGNSDRLNGVQLTEVTCSIPGTDVAALLTSADPSKPVSATVGVDAGTHQLRRVTLVGPFFSATQASTFTVVLDKYGENVSVTPPAT